MTLEASDEDEILREESERNFAQRPRYLLKFARKQHFYKEFLSVAALSSAKLAFESDVLLGFLAKATLHSKVIVKVASVL
nr:hypothetical protein [uncultured Campylobacter sp.]